MTVNIPTGTIEDVFSKLIYRKLKPLSMDLQSCVMLTRSALKSEWVCTIYTVNSIHICYKIHCVHCLFLKGTAEQPLVKRAVKKRKTEPPKLTDFSIETTKSVRDSCYDCKQLFVVPEVRIMHVVYNTDLTDDRSGFGGQATWYHVICFARLRSALGWLQSGESLPGFKRLSNADKVMVERHIP